MKQFYFFCFLFLYSCTLDSINEDKYLYIDEKEMSIILEEIYLAESRFKLNKINNIDEANEVLDAEYQRIYRKYNINSDKFSSSLEYYSKSPDVLKKIYSTTLESLKQNQLILK